jgi:ribonuclease P protein component
MDRIGKNQERQGSTQDPQEGAGSSGGKQYSFSKNERLRRRLDFQLVLRRGSRRHTEHFTVVLRPNALQFSRLGLTVSKKVGSAVKRNRVKRCLREFFRLHKAELPASHDLVIIARQGAASLAYRDVCEELAPVLLKNKSL